MYSSISATKSGFLKLMVVRLYSGRHTASSVTESSLGSMRINVLAESEEGGAAEKPGGPLSQNARP